MLSHPILHFPSNVELVGGSCGFLGILTPIRMFHLCLVLYVRAFTQIIWKVVPGFFFFMPPLVFLYAKEKQPKNHQKENE